MVNTLRNRRSLFLFSPQGVYNASDVSWEFRFEEPIAHYKDAHGKLWDQPRVGLLNANIPMSFYVVTSSNNQLRVARDDAGMGGAVDTVVTIPPGNYTATGMVAVLNALTQAVMSGTHYFVWSFDVSSFRLLATDNDGGMTTYEFGGSGTTAGGWLGLEDNGAVIFKASAYCPQLLDLSGPRYIFVDINLPLESSDSSGRARGVLAAIPVAGRPGTVQYWQPATVQYHLTSFDSLRGLNVCLTDETHTPIDLNGVPWGMEIEFV